MLDVAREKEWVEQARNLEIGRNIIYAAQNAGDEKAAKEFLLKIFNDQADEIISILRSYLRDFTDKGKERTLTNEERRQIAILQDKIAFIIVYRKKYAESDDYKFIAQLIELWTLWTHGK